jgi:hypothetical protein
VLDRLASETLAALDRRGIGLSLAMAGGGSAALSAIAGRQGASAVLIDGRLAYSRKAADELRGCGGVGGFCSAEMALDLAHAAHSSAVALDDRHRKRRLGIGVASALATDPPRSGCDRAHLAVVGEGTAGGWFLNLDAWPGDRDHQELLTGAATLLAAWRGAGCGPGEPRGPAGLVESLSPQAPDPAYWLDRVVSGRLPWVRCESDGSWSGTGKTPAAVLAGSFNPLHDGHLGLAAAAGSHLGTGVELELSMQNVDKERIDIATAVERVVAVSGRAPMPIVVDSAATFVEKSALLPGTVFVIGADTAVRTVDPRYYGGDEATMRAGLDRIRANGCSFLVAGREIAGRYVGFGQLDLMIAADLFAELPESAFRLDISSSQFRGRRSDPATPKNFARDNWRQT